MKQGLEAVKLGIHEGYWYEQPDFWSKYLRRPEALRELCFAQFGRMYKGASKKDTEEEDDLGQVEDFQESKEEEVDDNEKFHFVMTFRNKREVVLPGTIMLKNTLPCESALMQTRISPCALRFHKVKKDKDPKRYILNEVMLYYPLTEDITLEKAEELYNDEFKGERKVQIVKRQVMEFLEGVQEARYYAEQVIKEKDMDLQKIAIQFDPAGAQDNEDCLSEPEELHEDFEYFNPDNLEHKEESSKKIFRKVELTPVNQLKEMTLRLDSNQRRILDIVVHYCRNIVKARKIENPIPTPPFIMVHGGAGAGKSTVIHVISEWTQRILQQAGDNVEQPYVVKAAPTGCASSNIEGTTLHGAFGFSFDNKHNSLPDKFRDQRKAAMKNLKIVIIDEISMVKVDMLYQLDLRLQEIKEKVGTPFGGVSIIAFGDLMQLRPVMGKFIFEAPMNPEYSTVHKLASRWEMFTSVLLEKNHRQGRDKDYADLLNRIRTGVHTEEDLDVLRTRVRPLDHKDVTGAELYIGCVRADVGKMNDKYLRKLPGEYIRIYAVNHHPTMKNYDPKPDKKDGAIGKTAFLAVLTLKVGAKVMIIHNIDVPDMLTNGQLGVLRDVIRIGDGKHPKNIQILVVELRDKKAGKSNQEKNKDFAKKYPGCVFIERVSWQYSLTSKKTGTSGATATVIQFPLRVAHGITAHKIQGQSILFPSKVAMDLQTVFEPAQAYVMLSRIQCLEQLVIVDKLVETKIKTYEIAEEELKRLERISLNRNPTPWDATCKKDTLKIASLNCAGFFPHLKDLAMDARLMKGDVIHLDETSITEENTTDNLKFEDHRINFVNVGKGKGIAAMIKNDLEYCREEIVEDNLQIMKISFKDLDSINVYRSAGKGLADTYDKIHETIDQSKVTLITGDFNVCLNKNPNNLVTMKLKKLGFTQLVDRCTHVEGGQIDHIYWKDLNRDWKDPKLEFYSPYYSDHDGLLVTLTKR